MSLAAGEEYNADAPWARAHAYGGPQRCETCLYYERRGWRRGLGGCLLWSTPRLMLARAPEDRCHSWEPLRRASRGGGI